MAHADHHMMQLDKTHDSGAEEWYCPVCERRFIVQWPPAYKKIILNAGDEYASHSGGKGGVWIGTSQVANAPADETADEPEQPLAQVWLDAIETLDFGE
jgi:hypothetical protein